MSNQQPPPPPPPPAGGPPPYSRQYPQQPQQPQQPPPTKRGGCGKAALIALAVLGGLFVIAVIAAIAGGGDDDNGDTATDDTTETTAAGETTAPGAPATEGEPDEVDDVTLTECANQPGLDLAVARGSIVNDSSDTSTYFIEVNVVDAAGTIVGNGVASVANVPPDGNATWEAPATAGLPEGGQCLVTSVDRLAS